MNEVASSPGVEKSKPQSNSAGAENSRKDFTSGS